MSHSNSIAVLAFTLLLWILGGCSRQSIGEREFNRNLKALSKQDFGTVEYFMMEHGIPEAYAVVEERSRHYDYLDVGDTFSTYYWDIDSREMIAAHARFWTTARHSFYDSNFNLISSYGGSDVIIYWGSRYKPHPCKNGIIQEVWRKGHLNDTIQYNPGDSVFFFFEDGKLVEEFGTGEERDTTFTTYTYVDDKLITIKVRGGVEMDHSFDYRNEKLIRMDFQLMGGDWIQESDYKEEELWYDDRGYPMRKVVRTVNDTIVLSYHF